MTRFQRQVVGALFALALSTSSFGQAVPAAVLAMDLENFVSYQQDFGDATKFATDPNVPTLPEIRNFQAFVFVADVVAVNGKPVKGTFTARGINITRTTTISAGNAIADSAAGPYFDIAVDISYVDGVQIGTIMASGWGATARAPGVPAAVTQGNFTVTGGTGAFLGVRGQLGAGAITVAGRSTSVAEDPAYRRINGGGSRRYIFHLLPLERPEIVNVWHADFTPVTAAKPAHADEVLIVSARGLGPTRPGIDPGAPFPPFSTASLQVVNSPVEVTFGGAPTEVINQVGWPGEQNLYRVDFRVPKAGGSTAQVQLTVAWIGGPALTVPVQ
jgi:uncharacterized protein (TIGR03437 family)